MTEHPEQEEFNDESALVPMVEGPNQQAGSSSAGHDGAGGQGGVAVAQPSRAREARAFTGTNVAILGLDPLGLMVGLAVCGQGGRVEVGQAPYRPSIVFPGDGPILSVA